LEEGSKPIFFQKEKNGSLPKPSLSLVERTQLLKTLNEREGKNERVTNMGIETKTEGAKKRVGCGTQKKDRRHHWPEEGGGKNWEQGRYTLVKQRPVRKKCARGRKTNAWFKGVLFGREDQ